MGNALKSRIFGTALGQALLRVQQDLSFRTMSLRNPEQAGIRANHIIADRLIARLCPRGGTFLDIGAQYGAVFSAACRQDATLNVIAFEAETAKAARLREVFPNCQVFDLAVAETEGTATFFINPDASGYNSLVPRQGGKTVPVTVRMAALDSLLPDIDVDVIKIDIEGAELGALRGGERLIERSKPVIMFECVLRDTNALGYSASLIWQWFSDRGFRLFTTDRLAHAAPALGLEAFIDAQQYPFRSHNYFAVHDDRIAETRNRARLILGVAR